MKGKAFISGGHSALLNKNRDNGASGNGYVEGVEADKFRNLVVAELKKLNVPVITDGMDTILKDTLANFKNKSTENDVLIEFHFNAASSSATGTEVLIPDNFTSKEKEIATNIGKIISETLAVKNRGVKTEKESARGRLGWMRQVGSTVLPEICFITNKYDMESFEEKKEELAKKIAIYIVSIL